MMSARRYWPAFFLWLPLAAAETPDPAVTSGSVVPAQLPSHERLPLRDPTKVTRGFEKTFRDLSAEFNSAPAPSTPQASTLPDFRLAGGVFHPGENGGTVLIQVGDQLVRLRDGDEESTVYVKGQLIRLKLNRMSGKGVQLLVLPFNQTITLR